jgi:hypothetical protein
MNILRTLVSLRPGNSITFKNDSPETLSNVVWMTQKIYTLPEYEELEDKSNLLFNEEAGVYTEAPFTIPTQQECDDYWNNTLKNELALNALRRRRNAVLANCDWVVIRATSTDTPVPDEWKTYMQALRDLPSNTEDPANPVWPSIPTS